MRYGLALTLLLVATTAYATDPSEVFVYGHEMCVVDSASDLDAVHIWQEESSNLPATSTTTFGDATNQCSLAFTPSSGAAEYYANTNVLSGDSVGCALFWLYVSAVPASSGVRKIMSFEDGSGNDLAFLTIETDGGSGFTLRTWYEDQGNECIQATNNGTECSTNADCYSIDTADICSTGYYGSDTGLSLSTWYVVGVEQDNTQGDAGDIRLKTYVGAPGAVLPVSQPTKPQGSCSETIATYEHACGSDDDCNGFCTDAADATCCTGAGTGTCTCTTTDVKTISKVNIGTDDTVASASMSYLIDNIYVSDGSCSNAIANARIHALHPNADDVTNWSTNGCTNHDDCVDDASTSGPDSDTTYLDVATGTGVIESLSFTDLDLTETCSASVCGDSNIACATNSDCQQAGPAVDGVGFYSYLRKIAGNTNKNTSIQAILSDSDNPGSTIDGSVFQFSKDYADTNYHPGLYLSSLTQPLGGPWTAGAVDSILGQLSYSKSNCKTSCAIRNSEEVIEAWVELPTPVVPGVIPDKDSDSKDTVGFIGNSRLNAPLEAAMLDGLIEVDNIYDCATGGTTIGDPLANIDVVKEGGTTGHFFCAARKGSTGATLDVAVIMMGINTMVGMAAAPPRAQFKCDTNSDCKIDGSTCTTAVCSGGGFCTGAGFLATCTTNTDCSYCTDAGPQGYCFDNGGGDDGNVCWCPENKWIETDPAVREKYCIVGDGAGDFGTVCESVSDCACATNADCKSGNQCSAGVCTVSAGNSLNCSINGDQLSTYCMAGCLSAEGCPDGVCVAGNSQSTTQQTYRALAEGLAANGAEVVLVASPPLYALAGPLDTTVGGLCTGGVCKTGKVYQACSNNTECAVVGCWSANPLMDSLNSWLKTLAAEDSQYHFVDMPEWMSRCCPDGSMNQCLDDGVHTNTTGSQCMANILKDCLTQGTADGVCTAVDTGVCQSAECSGSQCLRHETDSCSTNGDCHDACDGGYYGKECSTNTDCSVSVCSSGKTGTSCSVNSDCNIIDCRFPTTTTTVP